MVVAEHFVFKIDKMHSKNYSVFRKNNKIDNIHRKGNHIFIIKIRLLSKLYIITGALCIVPVLDFAFNKGMPELLLLYILMFGFGSFFITVCPRCGRSVFLYRLGLSAPWPAKTCSRCGLDLREAHAKLWSRGKFED